MHLLALTVTMSVTVGSGVTERSAVDFHLPGLIGMPSHPDMQKIRKIGFFFENRLHWQSEVRLLLFTVCTCV
jgi:hypothetical protein